MAEISVIVPVYGVEAFLDRCVKSVLNQSFEDLELILVDDGSPDRCPAMCDGYAEKDRRIHVIHQKNGGLSAARNTGLQYVQDHSASSWVTFLDSDDWLHRDTLLRQLQAAREQGGDLVLGSFVRVQNMQEDRDLGPLTPQVKDPETIYAEKYGLCMSAWCKLISRSLLKDFRFPEGKLHEDCFVTHELIFRAGKIVVLEEPLYYYYFNPESITRKSWKPNRLQEIEAHRVRLAFLRSHGFHRAEQEEQAVLVQTIYEQLEAIQKTGDKAYRSFFADLRLQLRIALKEAKGLIPLNMETAWYYLMAYPLLPLWHLGRKAQKCWHSIKNNTQKAAH